MQISPVLMPAKPITAPESLSKKTSNITWQLKFQFLSPAEIIRSTYVCRYFQALILSDLFIRNITECFKTKFPDVHRKLAFFLERQINLKKEEATSLMFQLYDSFYRIERNLSAGRYTASFQGPFKGYSAQFVNSRYFLSSSGRDEVTVIDLNKKRTVAKVSKQLVDLHEASGEIVGWNEATQRFILDPFFETHKICGEVLSKSDNWILTGKNSGSLFVWDRHKNNKLLAEFPSAIFMPSSADEDSDDEGRRIPQAGFSGQIIVDEEGGRIAIFDDHSEGSLAVWDVTTQKRVLEISLDTAEELDLVCNDGDGHDEWSTNFCFHGDYLRPIHENPIFLHIATQKKVSFKAQEGAEVVKFLPKYALTLLKGSLYLENLFKTDVAIIGLQMEVKQVFYLGENKVLIQDPKHQLYLLNIETKRVDVFLDPAQAPFTLKSAIIQCYVLGKNKCLLLVHDKQIYFLDEKLKKIFVIMPEKPPSFQSLDKALFIDNCLIIPEATYLDARLASSGHNVHVFDFLPGENPEQILNSKRLANPALFTLSFLQENDDEKRDEDDVDAYDPGLHS